MQSLLRRCASLVLVGLFALPLATAAETRAWIPHGITLPDEHEIMLDQQIGSSTRILQILVETDPLPLFDDWQAALVAGGYEVDDSMLFDGRLLFSGIGVETGQIVVQQFEVAEFMIQIDATFAAE